MWEDPIVAEIHRVREQMAAEFNYDVAAFFADLRKRQTALGSRLKSPTKRPEPTVEAGQTPQLGSTDSTASDAAPAA